MSTQKTRQRSKAAPYLCVNMTMWGRSKESHHPIHPCTPAALWSGRRWVSPRTGSPTPSPTLQPSWSTWWTLSATRRTRGRPTPASGPWGCSAATWRCCSSCPLTSSTPSTCRWAHVHTSLLLCWALFGVVV